MKNFNIDNYIFSVDGLTGESYSICDVLHQMRKRIEKLEQENLETTNTLYEIMNSLDGIDYRISTIEKILKE
jgi:uncharacterized protein (UPF0335 family)